jgi:uncharacterized protein YutE (UPF0331/DUF86 family)
VVEFRYAQGRIAESVHFITEEIAEFEEDYADKTWRDYQEDGKLQKLIDRTVENVLTALVEVCGAFVAERGAAPDNYADVLRSCARSLKFSHDDQEALAGLAVQRNRLAHRYLDLRWHAVRDFAAKKELVKTLLTRVLKVEEEKIKR